MRKRYVDVKRCLVDNLEKKGAHEDDMNRMFYEGIVGMPEETETSEEETEEDEE